MLPAQLVPGPGAFAGVRASVLLTGVQTGVLALLATAAELVAAGAYLGAARRLSRRPAGTPSRRWPARHSAAFILGLVSIWVAVGSGLAAYDRTNVTLHLAQHVLLMMVAPPLLALGRPLALAAQASRRPVQIGITRFMRSRGLWVLTHPVPAGLLYFGAMWAMLVDRGVYDYLIGHEAVHDASHVALIVVGLLYWSPLVAPDASRHRLSPAGRMVLLLLSMPAEALPGEWLRFQSTPIDPINNLADTRTGGEVFLIAATAACSLWLIAVAVQWFAFALREERRELKRSTEAAEWTVPSWVTSPGVERTHAGPG